MILTPNKKPRFQKELRWRGQGYDCKWDFISNKKHFVTTLCIINISSAKSWMNKVFFLFV